MENNNNNTLIPKMTVTRLIEYVNKRKGIKQSFCFVLGTGASSTSIKISSLDLMKKWRQELIEMGLDSVVDCASELKYQWDECKHIFEDDEDKLNLKDYNTLYNIRFFNSSEEGFIEMMDTIEGCSPSSGYYYLASVLNNTDNHLVISMNYDSFIEEALYHYSGKFPLALNSDTIAPYMLKVDMEPVVAKIHRNFLKDSSVYEDEKKQIVDNWKNILKQIFDHYIPIIIGYEDNDDVLLSLFSELNLKKSFWCVSDNHLKDDLKSVISKNKGSLININSFDDLMYQFATSIEKIPNLDNMVQNISERIQKYREIQGTTNKDIKVNEISATAEDYYKSAFSLFISGSYEEALKEITKAIKLSPKTAKYYKSRGATLHKMKRYEEALKDETKAIELEPTNAEYYHSRGATLFAMGRYDEALKDATEAIKYDSTNAEYYKSRGVTLYAMGRYDEALKDATEAIKLDSTNAEYYHSRGATLFAMGRYDEALKDATEAIKLDSTNAEYYKNRAVTLDAMGRHDEALKDGTEAIKLEPTNAEYYNSRGVTLDAMGRYDEALKDATKAIELEPTNAKYYNSRAVALFKVKRYEESLRYDKKAIELNPLNSLYYFNSAVCYLGIYETNTKPETHNQQTDNDKNILKKALTNIDKAIELDAECSEYYDLRSLILQYCGFDQESLKDAFISSTLK